jgi:hypothetical protein
LSGCGRRRHDRRVRLEWRRTVGVGRRRRRSGVFPRFSAYGIGLSSVCGKSCSTTIVGLRAPATSPLFMWHYATGGPLPYMASAPQSGRGLDWFPNSGDLSKRKGDHIPNKKAKSKKKNTIMTHDTHARISMYSEKELHTEV